MKKCDEKSFKLGDCVYWESQAGGFTKKKIGVVDQVVPIGKIPNAKAYRILGTGFGMSRNHESYAVKVVNVLYWPRVSALRKYE